LPAILGVVYGHISVAGTDPVSHGAMRETLEAYAAQAGNPPDGVWAGIALVLAAVLLLYLSGTTAAGLLLIPIIVLAHGYLLSFTVTSVMLTAGGAVPFRDMAWKMGAVFLPVCLLEWPALLLLAAQSTAGAKAHWLRGFSPPIRWEYPMRAIICGASLCLAVLVRAWPMPWLLTTFLL